MRGFIIWSSGHCRGVLGYLHWDSEHNTLFKVPGVEIKKNWHAGCDDRSTTCISREERHVSRYVDVMDRGSSTSTNEAQFDRPRRQRAVYAQFQ